MKIKINKTTKHDCIYLVVISHIIDYRTNTFLFYKTHTRVKALPAGYKGRGRRGNLGFPTWFPYMVSPQQN